MTKVLFVCLGNICRSPMAEAVFRHLVMKENLASQITIDSCGTGGWHAGEPPHQGTCEVLEKHGILWKGQKARKISNDDFIDFDHIVAMDEQNRQDIILLAGKQSLQPRSLTLLADHLTEEDRKKLRIVSLNVPDPYYTGEFDRVFDLVHHGAVGLLKMIKENHL